MIRIVKTKIVYPLCFLFLLITPVYGIYFSQSILEVECGIRREIEARPGITGTTFTQNTYDQIVTLLYNGTGKHSAFYWYEAALEEPLIHTLLKEFYTGKVMDSAMSESTNGDSFSITGTNLTDIWNNTKTISKVELYIDSALRKTCTDLTTSCSLSDQQFTLNSTHTYFAKVYGKSQSITTPIRTFTYSLQTPKWSAFEKLDGPIIGAPAIASWGTGRLDVFAVKPDNNLYTRTFSNGRWSAWQSIDVNVTANPAAVSWAPGRIDVFVRGMDGYLYHAKYDSSNPIYMMEKLDKQIIGGPAVTSWGEGRLDVIVRGTDNALWHKSFSNNEWSNWVNIGGTMTSDPAAVSWGPGRIDVFARGTDNRLYWTWFSNNTWLGWFQAIDGQVASGPSVSSWGPGHLDVFAMANDQNKSLIKRTFDNNTWTNWQSLGSSLTADPGSVSNGVDSINVVIRAWDGYLWYTRYGL